jgi:hypothetical protein
MREKHSVDDLSPVLEFCIQKNSDENSTDRIPKDNRGQSERDTISQPTGQTHYQ